MTKRSSHKASPNAHKAVGGTVTIPTKGAMPLLGLELTDIENKQEYLVSSTNNDESPSPFPLLGTSFFQHTVNPTKSLLQRFENSVCYTTLLHKCATQLPHSDQKTANNGQNNCYTNMLHKMPKGLALKVRQSSLTA